MASARGIAAPGRRGARVLVGAAALGGVARRGARAARSAARRDRRRALPTARPARAARASAAPGRARPSTTRERLCSRAYAPAPARRPAGQRRGGRAELLRQLERAQRCARALASGSALQRRRLDVHRVPRHVELRRQPRGAAHQLLAGARPARRTPAAPRASATPRSTALRCRYASISSSTRSAVRRSASSRSAIRLPLRKKFFDRALGLLAAGRPCLPSVAASSSSGGRSTTTTSSASSNTRSGTVSHTRTPVMPLTMSFRLSRCCTFIVVQTSMPASSSSSTSCQRFGMPRARRVGVRELVDQHQRRLARERARRGRTPPACGRDTSICLPRQTLEPGEQRFGLGAAVRLDDADDDVDALRARARARPASIA